MPLNVFSKNFIIYLNRDTQNKIFADVVHNVCDIPLSELPNIDINKDMIVITIPEEESLIGLKACKHNIHARKIWPKGTTPSYGWCLAKPANIALENSWQIRITSLRKGFHKFSFSTI